MKRLALLLLALPLAAAAQVPYLVKPSCIPEVKTPGWIAGVPEVQWNTVGVCVRWFCGPDPYVDNGTYQVVQYCGTWAEFAKVPGRIATIKKATDPLKSAQTAGSRYVIVPLTDPSMAGLPKF
jgi:hypothetical protein